MNKIYTLCLAASLLFSSCAYHAGLTSNANLHNTDVVLSKKNFKVIGSVQGKSQITYVLGFGGLSKAGMVADARTRMLVNANIVGEARAIINETVEVKHTIFPIVRTYTVIVSGHIVEFTD